MRPARLGAVLAAVAVLVTGCSGGGPVAREPQPSPSASVAPAPPRATSSALAPAKKAAGIESCPSTSPAEPVDGGLPDITLGCLGGGRPVDLAALRGTPTVINIWAQWCGPCREEAPFLAAVSASAQGKVRFLGIDYVDTRPKLAIEFARQAGWHYPQLVDGNGKLRVPLKMVGPPMTLFVDADGTVAGTHAGPFTSQQQLRHQIREYLGVRL